MATFKYFAYGSNMLKERLQARCPSAKPIGTAIAQGYCLRFIKKSIDDSGKATLVKVDQAQSVYGVLYEIEADEIGELDRFEDKGHGYERCDKFPITYLVGVENEKLTAITYLATKCDDTLIPYDWYHALVLAGAIQQELPEAYIGQLRDISTESDPKKGRCRRTEALSILEDAGFQRLAGKCL